MIPKPERVKILKNLELISPKLDTAFYEIAQLAALICQAPVSAIIFPGNDFQAINTVFGWERNDPSLMQFFCSRASNSTSSLCIVEDTRKDPSLQHNALVTGDPRVSFYASAPIFYQKMFSLGFIGVIDFEPRTLSEAQIKGLEALSHQVIHLISQQMELVKLEKEFTSAKAENENNSKSVKSNFSSENKLAQTAKKEPNLSEYIFKSLVQDGGDLIAILDLDGIYTYVSPTSSSILGISPEEFIGKNAFDFIHIEDLPQVLDDFQTLKTQIRIAIAPFRFKNSRGEWRWIETNMINMLDDPAIEGVVANSRDVTDKINSQHELIVREQGYRAFLDSQTNYFIRTDLQGNYTHVNNKFSQEFGWVYEQDFLGKNSLISICDYHHPRVFEVVNFCLSEPGRVFKVELDKPSKIKGEVITTLWDFICIKDSNGEPEEIQCSGIDVTDTIYYEKELRRSNERFELVNQANSEYIYEFYPVANRLFLSEKFENIFGFKRLNESENYDLLNRIRHPLDNGRVRENFEHKVFETEETFFTDSYRILKEDGEILWVKDSTVILRNDEGKSLRVIGSVRDITEFYYYQEIDRIERDLTTYLMGKQYTLEEVANGFLENLEAIFPGMKTSVMEVLGGFVYPVAAPSLPKGYLEAISGFPIGENEGSCGTAVFTKSLVIVKDVQNDLRWNKYKNLGSQFGFSACWSAPIFNEKGDVVGTFGCYYDSVRAPFKYELYAIERAQRLFNLIFTQYEFLGSIKRNIELFELINQATKDAIYDWDLINNQLIFGDSYTYNFGHPVDPENPIPIKDWEVLIHPDDRKKAISDLQEFLQNPKGEKWENEFRFKKSDGSFAFVEEIGTVLRESDGTPVRMVGLMRDVTDYKGIQQLLDDSTAISKLGGWEWDLSKSLMTWTKTGYEIHEVPLDFETTYENGISLYREDYREILRQAVSDLIDHNQPIDLEAVLVTPSGNEKWVRVKGNCEFQDLKCVKILGSIQDIHSRKLDELEIQYQNLLLNSLTEVISLLFQEDDWSVVIDSSFELIGNTVGVDRIYLFENHKDPLSGARSTSQKFEWVKEGVPTQINNPQLQNMPLDNYLNFALTLEQKQLYKAKISEVEEENLRQAMISQQIKAFLIFPVFVEEEFWGFIGFDDCTTDRDWKSSEINFLQSVTSNLESSIMRRKDKISLERLVAEKNSILESLIDGFFVIDSLGYINYWNKAAETLIGIPREEIVGFVLWDKYRGADKIRFMLDFIDLIGGQKELHVEEFYPEFGKWLEISAYPASETVSVFFRDVTERKSFQEAIMQSNERFEIIAKATNDILWDYNLKNDELYVSEGFNSQFGYDVESKFNSLLDFLNLIHPEDRNSVEDQLIALLKNDGEDMKLGIDYRIRKGDGSYSFIQHKTFFIRERNGRAIRALGAMVDITPRKIHEESLKSLNLELNMRVKELAVSNLELEQFAYVTSHDLQEPLRMITSFLTLLENKYGTQLDDKAKQYIGFAVDGAKRMRQLILDLLDYSRSGKSSQEKQFVDLNEIVNQVYHFHRRNIEAIKGEINYNNLPFLFVSNVSIFQVIQNLIENAIKYTNPDIPPLVSINAEEKDSEWLISVTDNGIGIEKEFHEKIFVIFQRLHNLDKYNGTGIGLSIVKKQVESWGGKIWVESKLEEGSTFFFTIPKEIPLGS